MTVINSAGLTGKRKKKTIRTSGETELFSKHMHVEKIKIELKF